MRERDVRSWLRARFGWLSVREITAFAATGLTATAVHAATGALLHRAFGVDPLTANLVAFGAGTTVTLYGNARVTFSGQQARPASLFRAAAVILFGLGMNQAIVALVTGPLALPYEAALAVIIGSVPAVTFLLFKFWAFRR